MKAKALFMQYGLGQILLLGFALMNTWFPQYTMLFIIFYIVVFGAIMVYYGKKMIKGRIKDMDLVKGGKRIYKAKVVEVKQLMMSDPLLVSEMKGQFLTTFLPLLSIMAIWLIFPYLRGILVTGEAGSITLFIRYAILYELFFVISIISRITQSIMTKHRGYTTLFVLNEYTVTEKGIYSEQGGGFALAFPLKAKKITCNEKRSYVDIDVVQEGGFAGKTIMRIRLYSKKPLELYEKIKERVQMSQM